MAKKVSRPELKLSASAFLKDAAEITAQKASPKVTLADCSATFERLERILFVQVEGAEKLADGLAGGDGMKVGAAIRPEPIGAIGALNATAGRVEDLLSALEGHLSRIAQAVG